MSKKINYIESLTVEGVGRLMIAGMECNRGMSHTNRMIMATVAAENSPNPAVNLTAEAQKEMPPRGELRLGIACHILGMHKPDDNVASIIRDMAMLEMAVNSDDSDGAATVGRAAKALNIGRAIIDMLRKDGTGEAPGQYEALCNMHDTILKRVLMLPADARSLDDSKCIPPTMSPPLPDEVEILDTFYWKLWAADSTGVQFRHIDPGDIDIYLS